MPSNKKKPHSAIPTVQNYDRKKKAKPVEPEVEKEKEYKSPAAPPDSEGDSNARQVLASLLLKICRIRDLRRAAPVMALLVSEQSGQVQLSTTEISGLEVRLMAHWVGGRWTSTFEMGHGTFAS
jgi:hypothetical protein